MSSSISTNDYFSAWISATRPKTLTNSLAPFVSGFALAYAHGASLDWFLLLSAIATAICIQIATNLINDAFDVKRGTDDQNRLGPQRVLQKGLSTPQEVFSVGLMFFALAWLCALPLIFHGGILIVAILTLSMLCGYAYTGGPFPLAYNGLGDLFVIIFYGWVGTMASYWLQVGSLNFESLLLGTQIGLLSTSMLAINNLRDIRGDAKSQKRTLPVRFGAFFGRLEISICILLPFALNFLWLATDFHFAAALPWIAFSLALPLVAKIWKTEPSKAYNEFLAMSGILQISFSLLISCGFFIDRT